MSAVTSLQIVLLAAGCFFFFAGTVALLRFPDTFTRIHALTKADNLGLGMVTLALLPEASSVAVAGKLLLIWLVTLAASATVANLIAGAHYGDDRSVADPPVKREQAQ